MSTVTGLIARLLRRATAPLRWRLGMRVAAPDLEAGTDEAITRFYDSRTTDCGFLGDPEHYEHPRARWMVGRVSGGSLLEVGCGNGGMTRLLAPRVDRVVALDVSGPSLAAVRELGLPNVETVQSLVERYRPATRFDWIVASEVIEHLRDPRRVMRLLVSWLAPGGTLLVTTPRGHWESDEHLHEFTLARLTALLVDSGGESISVAYLRDRGDRRRWLVGEVRAPTTPPAPDRFDDPLATIAARRSGRAPCGR